MLRSIAQEWLQAELILTLPNTYIHTYIYTYDLCVLIYNVLSTSVCLHSVNHRVICKQGPESDVLSSDGGFTPLRGCSEEMRITGSIVTSSHL